MFRAGLQAQWQHGAAHAAVGVQAAPRALECGAQVLLVEHDERIDAGVLGRDQGPGELALGELGVCRQEHQHLVEVGGKGLGAQFVLAVEEVAAGLDALDAALVAGGLPLNAVAHDHRVLLAARVAEQAAAVVLLHEAVAAVRSHHQAGLKRCHQLPCSASTARAQKKSLTEMPFTSWVLKRSVQRL